jgi:hypothetical protein
MAVTTYPASAKQMSFVESLAEQVHGDNAPEFLLAHREAGTFDNYKVTSALIDALLSAKRAMPRPAREARPVEFPEVPAARYALPGAAGWEFYKVDRPTKGKWAGYLFVKRLYGSPGDFREVRVGRSEVATVMADIVAATYRDGERELAGAEAAAVAFSREHGVCAACLAPLTDPESIARGLGPICAGRF